MSWEGEETQRSAPTIATRRRQSGQGDDDLYKEKIIETRIFKLVLTSRRDKEKYVDNRDKETMIWKNRRKLQKKVRQSDTEEANRQGE